MKMNTSTRSGVCLASFVLLLGSCTSGGSADRSLGSSTTSRSAGAGDGWPQCGAARGRPIGCFATVTATVAAASVTTTSTPTDRACRGSDLRVTGGESQGAGGTRYTGLGFTNRSSSPCTLAGHPKVSFLDRSGRVLGRALPTPGPETVIVSPGQYADNGPRSRIDDPRGLPTDQPGHPTNRSARRGGRIRPGRGLLLLLLPRWDGERPAFLRSIYRLTNASTRFPASPSDGLSSTTIPRSVHRRTPAHLRSPSAGCVPTVVTTC